jgi:hypothetical protein
MFTVVIPRVLIKPTKLVDKKTGAFVDEQVVTICHPDLFTPVQASVLLSNDLKPYEVGTYELGGDSITAGEYGRPAFRLVVGRKVEVGAARKLA